jgi:hypothetical protein
MDAWYFTCLDAACGNFGARATRPFECCPYCRGPIDTTRRTADARTKELLERRMNGDRVSSVERLTELARTSAALYRHLREAGYTRKQALARIEEELKKQAESGRG